MERPTLSTNGLAVPPGFPVAEYEAVHKLMATKHGNHALYSHYAGSWNALAYRYRAYIDSGQQFADLFTAHGSAPSPQERYLQERALFDFFSAGFSVFECTFYALYTFGAMLASSGFSLASERDQQRVTPTRTKEAFTTVFPSDPILNIFSTLFADPEYQRLREIRNILTHRTAPGRRIYVSLGDDMDLPTEWKLNNSPLDASIVSTGVRELNRLLSELIGATSTFVTTKL